MDENVELISDLQKDQESDNDDVPDVITAKKLVEEFDAITNTNEALAQFYLQENKWELQGALNSFFNEKMKREDARLAEELSQIVQTEDQPSNSGCVEEGLRNGTLTTEAPEHLTVVSWNIDGLDIKNIKKRTKAVCKILEDEKADIVFLQEVIPETLEYIKSKLSGYECIPGTQGDYFVVTLLRWGRVYKDASRIIPFPGTRMDRHLLHVEAHCGEVQFDLLNSHLESTAEFASERMNQLKTSFNLLRSVSVRRNVIFGGDLNMRDKELAEVGGIPPGTKDCWQHCGAREVAKYTWDMTRNTNLEWAGKFKPKCRFDRFYLKQSTSFSAHAEHFGLIGLQKIHGTNSFPSDHWGILLKLKVNQKK